MRDDIVPTLLNIVNIDPTIMSLFGMNRVVLAEESEPPLIPGLMLQLGSYTTEPRPGYMVNKLRDVVQSISWNAYVMYDLGNPGAQLGPRNMLIQAEERLDILMSGQGPSILYGTRNWRKSGRNEIPEKDKHIRHGSFDYKFEYTIQDP